MKDLFAVSEFEVDESSGKDINFVVVFEANDYFKGTVPPGDHVGSHGVIVNPFGEAEVDEFDVEGRGVDHNIFGLDVAVHDVEGVEVGEGRAELDHDVSNLVFV